MEEITMKVKGWKCGICGFESPNEAGVILCEYNHKKVNCKHVNTCYFYDPDDKDIGIRCVDCGEFIKYVDIPDELSQEDLKTIYEMIEKYEDE